MSSRLDMEKTKQNIALILDKMRTDADPLLLNKYRGIFKKEVPLFRRSWAAAYLLMLFDQGATSGEKRGRSRWAADTGAARVPAHDEVRQYPLSEAESKRLFINAGRNRRVYPREILGIINSKTAIPRENIGAIRILDNYSFVQVRDTVAERIIEALNGMMFRGRPLVVNYAKSKAEMAESGQTFEPSESRQGQDDCPGTEDV